MTAPLNRRQAALTVPCSHCGAAIFSRCRIQSTGAVKNSPHMDRLRLTAGLAGREVA